LAFIYFLVRIWVGRSRRISATLLFIATAMMATPAVADRELSITLAGTGSGTVTSSPVGINCPGSCEEDFDNGDWVTLTFTPAAGSSFTSATGSCSSAGPSTAPVTENIHLNHDRACTVTFNRIHQLSVTISGAGTGTVASAPAGISCSAGSCAAFFNQGSSVTLTPVPGAGSQFTGWSGACSGVGAATVMMNAAASCTAIFTPTTHLLSITLAGTGTGTVSSAPAGLNCSGGTCSASFNRGTSVTLTPTASVGSTFTGWSGACSGTGAASFTLSADRTCTATFARQTKTLTVSLAGDGTGIVVSTPAGINCSASSKACSASFDLGAEVTLSSAATPGFAFERWSVCSHSADRSMVLTITADTTCTANFKLGGTLTIRIAGDGRGTVTSTPAGISCNGATGTRCSAEFAEGTSVGLRAVAASGSAFLAWSGACTTASRTVAIVIEKDVECIASFKPGPITPETGWWWNWVEAGRGYSIEMSNAEDETRIFLGAYMYDDLGNPVWYASTMSATADGSGFAGPLMYFHGGQTLFGSYAPPSGHVVGGAVGARIEFLSDMSGVMFLPAPDGSSAETRIPISRFPFVGDGLGTPPPNGAPLPEAGWWWNPAEAGRGIFLEVQVDERGDPLLFSALYGYESTGEPSWHIGSSTLIRGGSGLGVAAMPLLRCAGGLALGRIGAKPASCAPIAAGTTTIQFDSVSSAIVTLANGIRIPIQRFRF